MRPTLLLLLAAACATDDLDADLPTTRLELSWSLAEDGVPVSCAEVRASEVIIGTNAPGASQVRFPCEAGSGSTTALPVGRQGLIVGLGSDVGSLADGISFDVTLVEDETRVLDPVIFPVTRTGSVWLRIGGGFDYTDPKDCSVPGGTAELRIEVTQDGDCAGPECPAEFACRNKGEIEPLLPVGYYQLDIRERRVPAGSCFGAQREFSVYGSGTETDLGTVTLEPSDC